MPSTPGIIGGLNSQTVEHAKKLEDIFLQGNNPMDARRFIGFMVQLDQLQDGLYTPKDGSLKKALDSVVADMEKAGLTDERRKRNYEFFEGFALSYGLREKAGEYAGIIAGLNGNRYQDY